jgi:hypothetical protein
MQILLQLVVEVVCNNSEGQSIAVMPLATVDPESNTLTICVP